MGLRINTNVAALQANRNLSRTTKQLNRALERLASGKRIVRAGDDAAGLAISEGLKSQVRGLTQAVRNANDASGFLTTAEGALSEMTNITQRLRELAIQAANGSIGPDDRGFLDTERIELVNEFNRIATQTTFNTTKLLDGTFTTVDLQVGVQKGEKIEFTIGDARATALGKLAIVSGAQNLISGEVNDLAFGSGSDAVDIDIDADSDGFSAYGTSYSSIAIAAAVNAKTSQSGVRASALSTVVKINNIDSTALGGVTQLQSGDLQINDVDIVGAIAGSAQGLVDTINEFSATTGVVARFVSGSTDDIELVAQDGRNISIDMATTGAASLNLFSAFDDSANIQNSTNGFNVLFSTGVASLVSGGGASRVASTTGLFTGAIELSSADNIIVSGSSFSTALGFGTAVTLISDETSLSKIDLSTQAGAQDALGTLDATLSQLTELRANLGAIQNRLEAVVNSLSITNENLSAAASEISDADMAVQVADLTRAQILQQAGVAVLGQANASAQIALSLLQF